MLAHSTDQKKALRLHNHAQSKMFRCLVNPVTGVSQPDSIEIYKTKDVQGSGTFQHNSQTVYLFL